MISQVRRDIAHTLMLCLGPPMFARQSKEVQEGRFGENQRRSLYA